MNAGTLGALALNLFRIGRASRWDRSKLEAHQAAALAELRRFVYSRSPFYRRFHAGLEERPLAELPVLKKAVMMENFDDLVTDRAIHLKDIEAYLAQSAGRGRFLGGYVVNASSGSSGRRGVFVFDPREWASVLASYARVPGCLPLRDGAPLRMRRANVVSSTLWHQTGKATESLSTSLTNTLHLDAGQPVEALVPALNQWQPNVLVAYTSVAARLADEQLAGRLRISLRFVLVGTEVMTTEMRSQMERAWGNCIYDIYGATESGVLAAECARHRGMHLFEDQAIIEVVDGSGRPVPAGEYGEKLLLTLLFRKTQPLIRYQVSDMVRLSARACSCSPFRLIDSVQGRLDEVVHLPAVSGGTLAVHPIVFRRVLNALPSSGWELVQEEDRLNISISGMAPEFGDDRIIDPIVAALREQGAVAPPICVQRVDAVERGATGKAPLIRSRPKRQRE